MYQNKEWWGRKDLNSRPLGPQPSIILEIIPILEMGKFYQARLLPQILEGFKKN